MASPPPKLSYVPEPHERAYYSGLFLAADTDKTGKISGQQAVQFFARSKLPMEALKNVWTVADSPPTNYLDPPKFATAVRLIQFVQNQAKGQGANLATPPGVTLRPAFFEGVTGVTVQPPAEDGATPSPAPPTPPLRSATPPAGPPTMRSPTPPPVAAGTPPRPPTGAGGPSTALAIQDPYTLTPNEQARYEELFPKYAKEDGYCYGAAAVELFSKSGVPQTQLAAIWNMVDSPVDNRLDKLEFAMAMHLIVCVSRKNLPMPPSLPASLQQLKSQQPPGAGAAAGGAPPSIQRTATQDSMSAPPQAAMGMGGPPPPHPPPPPAPAMNQVPPEPPAAMPSPSMASHGAMSGPPPLEQTPSGGMSISDAFEGLSMTGGLPPAPAGPTPNLSMYNQPPTPAVEDASPEASSPPPAPRMPETASLPPVAVAAPTVPAPAPAADSYQMGTATEEALKLKATLQKLQAENISLKAQLGSMTEEELQVQKEVNATVAEIAKLSNELTTLRAQVLAAKSRLLEATAELKANHEKKGVLKDLISEASATKQTLEEAVNDMDSYMVEAAKQPPPPPAPAMEADLFGFGPTPGQGALPGSHNESLPPPSADVPSSYTANPYASPTPDVASPEPAPMPEPVGEDPVPAPAAFSIPEPEGIAAPPEPTLSLYQAPPAPQASSGAHRRDESTASAFGGDFLMGGSALPPASATSQNDDDHDHVVMGSSSMGLSSMASIKSMQEISELKMKAKEAEDLARDAEEGCRQKRAQVSELRRLADEANAEARRLADAGKDQPKKKGFMGRKKGPNKKDVKEAERVAVDAREKNEKLMAAQAEANDAEALARDTKREAERLRHEVEDAEIAAASAASMQEMKPPAPQPQSNGFSGGSPPPPPPPPQQQQQPPPFYGGQPTYGVYGQSAPPPPPPPAQAGGYNYNPSVMGSGGGLSIPTPQATQDYDNPFSS